MDRNMNIKKTDLTEYFLFFSKNKTLSYNLNKFIDRSQKILIPTMEDKRKITHHLNKIIKNTNSRKRKIKASQLNAMMLILEASLYLFHRYQEENNEYNVNNLSKIISKNIGENDYSDSLLFFNKEFLKIANYQTTDKSDSKDEKAIRQALTEEILLLWLANKNKAFSAFNDMFDDNILIEKTKYFDIIDNILEFYKDGKGFMDNKSDIIEILLEPSKKYPNSISSQLNFIIERWGDFLGDFLIKLLKGMDFIKEEEKSGMGGPGKQDILSYSGIDLKEDREKFSSDKDWMPNLVLIAKTVFVWLFQLSEKYNYPIKRLDQIPDEELDFLAESGITGLWLIGIWERSRASKKIKQLCGNPEALSSAYSIYNYRIADELGGEAALDNLKYRAEQRGIRLGADMVPNHMGIDSPWVKDMPEHFIQLDYSPYPSYSFNGLDLSDRDDIEIKIEDHYYDRTDAAVVFRWRNKNNGETRYIYHGNDGTSMPWNDTAQLNYLIPEVREAAIQTILSVSKKFPIIRFDAAMTLTKLHYHRLWFPEPGSGGDIPTRAEHGMSKEEFSKIIGEEFWSEVVRRVGEESNDTLLLAEAFWLMEAYFVRTLGMHRVYNSAFMNFLKNEDNAEFRTSIKNTVEFNPEILKRFVNFLNNPDEETAAVQFGKDDKYFGVTVLVSTLPGLPMLGHGQIEGYSEKYGMEYKRPYWNEKPDNQLIERHKREIFPLLKKRYMFSGVENFRLFDFYLHNGSVNENVIAYSNKAGNEASLAIFHNKFENTAGWLNFSSQFLKINGETKEMVRENLSNSLGLPNNDSIFIIFKDFITGLEYIRKSSDIFNNGLYIELQAFKYHVFLDFREVKDTKDGIYSKLNSELNGKGVNCIDDSISDIFLKPVIDGIDKLFRLIVSNKQSLKDIEDETEKLFEISNSINSSDIDISTLQKEFIKEINYIFLNEIKDLIPQNPNKNLMLLTFIIEKLGYIFDDATIDLWIINKSLKQVFEKDSIEKDINFYYLFIKTFIIYKKIIVKKRKDKKIIIKENFLDLLRIPTVKDFLGVNFYKRVEWFNKERAELLVDNMLYLSISEIIVFNNNKINGKDIKQINKYKDLAKLAKEAIKKSEYKFKHLIKYIEGYIEK